MISESPRFLISKGKCEKAYESIHGSKPNANEFLSEQNQNCKDWNILKHIKNFSIAFCLYTFLSFVSLYCGNVPFYINFDISFLTIVAFDMFGMIILIPFIIFMPRKPLLGMGLIVIGLFMVPEAGFFDVKTSAAAQAIFLFCRSLSFILSLVMNIQIVEMFPTRFRNTAFGCISLINYLMSIYASDICEILRTI
jgi:hypothetical protein